MKIDDIAKQLANKVNQEHYIKHYLEKVQRGAYNKGVKDAEAKQLILSGVSKSFNSEEELLQFIYMHTPIAIKPKSKRAKGQLVSAFKSGNAFDQVCRHLAKKLFNVC